MSSGKAIAQAGHAYLDAFLKSLDESPALAAAYRCLHPGTKITLAGGCAQTLRHLHEKLSHRGHSSVLIIDRDHVEYPDFDGTPVLTALGVGPISRADARKLLGKYALWPDHSNTGGFAMN